MVVVCAAIRARSRTSSGHYGGRSRSRRPRTYVPTTYTVVYRKKDVECISYIYIYIQLGVPRTNRRGINRLDNGRERLLPLIGYLKTKTLDGCGGRGARRRTPVGHLVSVNDASICSCVRNRCNEITIINDVPNKSNYKTARPVPCFLFVLTSEPLNARTYIRVKNDWRENAIIKNRNYLRFTRRTSRPKLYDVNSLR